MASGRNEPCPCGSGRKYKSCCLRADEERDRQSAHFGRANEPHWHDAARRAQSWQADVVPLPIGFRDDPDASPALAIVVAAGFIAHSEVLTRRPVGADARAAAVAEAVAAASRAVGVLPPRVLVRDDALARALREHLAGREIEVEVAPLPELDEPLDEALERMGGSRSHAATATLGTWAESEAPPEEIARFHAAAAAYFSAEPWTTFGDDEAVVLELEDGSTWTAVVMGGAGMEYGLALYADTDDFVRLLEGDAPAAEMLATMKAPGLAVHFDPRSELPRAMQREVAASGWAVAHAAAYPWLMGLRVTERRITAGHLWVAAAALGAMARLAEGADPTGDGVLEAFFLFEDDDDLPWQAPEAAERICPEGPGADPELALHALDEGAPPSAGEEARLERLAAWLDARAPSKAARDAARRNAETWTGFLLHQGLAAGAVTEYDLRVFLYDFYRRKGRPTKPAARALPSTMRGIVAFLEEEGIRYPYAERVLGELESIFARWRASGYDPKDALDSLLGAVWGDLDRRALLHETTLAGAPATWPTFMDPETWLLRHDLQRRWLLWYDEVVRSGITGLDALRQVLVGRQREWEHTPHPGVSGRTPAEVVRAYTPPTLG